MSGLAAILGAGVVGLACGLALRRAGFDVIIVDKGGPGEACSLGNAGHLGTGSVVPIATPGLWKQVPQLLRDPTSPLKVKPGDLVANLPWFLRFLANGTNARVERNAAALAPIVGRVHKTWAPILEEVAALDLVDRENGLMHVFRGAAAMERSRWAYELRERYGVRLVKLTAAEAREREPCLSEDIAGGYHMPDVWMVKHPLKLSQRIAARVEALGGTILRATATGVDAQGIRTAEGRVNADIVVLAAGAWSAPFAESVGVRVPLAAERGYHVMLEGSNAPVRQTLLLADKRVSVSPMLHGIRISSMAEYTHPDAPADHEMAARVLNGAESVIPGLGGKVASRWVGPRPSTPDSLPVIGRAPLASNVICAFGHGHLGLTMAALTAEAVTELAQGRPTSLDLTHVAPTRFQWRGRRAAA
jgi:D-amino-acid dehydrogenase